MKPDNQHLARTTDPATSKAAAKAVDLALNEKHFKVLQLLQQLYIASDDQIADAAVNAGVVERHEQARRLLRTLRDRTTFVAPALDEENSWQKTALNSSGRYALAWTLSNAGHKTLKAL